MNTKECLILKDGEDITAKVTSCQYNMETKRWNVTFLSGKTYSCSDSSIECLRNPEKLNPNLIQISHNGYELFNIRDIYVFHAKEDDLWHISFINGSERSYAKRNLIIKQSCLNDTDSQNCWKYLRQIAAINELRSEEGIVLLEKQYEKLSFIDTDTSMAVYLNPSKCKIKKHEQNNLIFPFGGNASQFKAVQNAIYDQMSVIQGPPGTGKTQTILNIIANLLVQGKTVQVVSNNNSATDNIMQKLCSPQYNLGFLVAALGKRENKKSFIQNQNGAYPDLSDWKMDMNEQIQLNEKIQSHINELAETFKNQERLSQARLELDALRLEMKYFKRYCQESEWIAPEVKLPRKLKVETLMQLWQECNAFSERERTLSFWFKFKSVFFCGISNWGFYNNSPAVVITLFQSLFYQLRASELEREVALLEKYLVDTDAKKKMSELTSWSMKYLQAKLFERYGSKKNRVCFTEDHLWKDPNEILREYPIVLSTTFSSRSCLNGVTYDYLIMDEASQVDIATGALALSSAQNAIIVGDLKQLPNVVKQEVKKLSDNIFYSYQLPQGYSFSENSFLQSVCRVLVDVPQTLLREHYRCHPRIIGFCNQKFYNNELLIMTEDTGEKDVLSLFKTNMGTHRRDRINQRQMDVTIQEVLPMLYSANAKDIGIIAPYNDQVSAISRQLDSDEIEVRTVHKFQGREKDTVIMMTVDDVVTEFSDDPYLLNVAVSRAKKRFCIVASSNDQPADSNIGDLMAYIEYNNFQIVKSKIYSVFDLLYRQYTQARISFLKSHPTISVYDSENIMYGTIVDILNDRVHISLGVICHHPMNMLIRDTKYLTDKEYLYAMNTATHVDFLIYNLISKKPILAIEVDGFRYHKEGTLQRERDKMKDHIMEVYEIPVLRLPTNGSEEISKIKRALDDYESSRKSDLAPSINSPELYREYRL